MPCISHDAYTSLYLLPPQKQMQMFYGLVEIPDFRHSRANPHYRAQRKAIEDANPHFDVNDAGLKATVLCVLAAIACSPRTKTEHGMNHQLERFQNKVEMAKKKVIMDIRGVRDTLGRDWDREGRIGIGGLKSIWAEIVERVITVDV